MAVAGILLARSFAAVPVFAVNSVVVESKTVRRGAVGARVRVRIQNDVTCAALVVPLTIYSSASGAYLTALKLSYAERISAGGPFEFMSQSRRDDATGACRAGGFGPPAVYPDTLTNPVAASPEGVLFSLASSSGGHLPVGADLTGSLVLTMDVNSTPGSFVIETTCVDPGNHLVFVDPGATQIAPAFTAGVISINAPPVISPIGPKTARMDALHQFTVSASDADQPAPTLLAANLPPGAVFVDQHDGTGKFSWTPNASQLGDHQVTFIAADGIEPDSEKVVITVVANLPPIARDTTYRVTVGATLHGVMPASDPDGDVLTYEIAQFPDIGDFSSLNTATGQFDYVPPAFPVTDQFLFFVNDGQATSNTATAFIVVVWDTIHVDTLGNDATGNGTRDSPFRTIQRAMIPVQSGQVVLVHPGTYVGPVYFPTQKTVLLISEKGPFLTIIEGDPLGLVSTVVMNAADDINTLELSGFTVRGADVFQPGCVYCAGGVEVALPTYAVIANNIITGNTSSSASGGIAFRGGGGIIANNWIVDNQAGGSGAGGLAIFSIGRPIFVNNTISGNRGIGPSSPAGIYLDGPLAIDRFCNNVVAFNTQGACVLAGSQIPDSLRNNLLFGNDFPPVNVNFHPATTILSDPLFLVRAGGDYHLTCPSPARESGNVAWIPADSIYNLDIDRQLRIRSEGGFKVDIGADQFWDADKEAFFYPIDTTCCPPCTALFSNRSLCIDEQWLWTFDDVDTLRVKNPPPRIYTKPGTYNVRLVAYGDLDPEGDTAFGTVRVLAPVTADFVASDSAGCIPFDVTFTANSPEADAFFWDFGDDSTDNSGPVVTHRYQIDTIYTVTLRAANACDMVDVKKDDFIRTIARPTVQIFSSFDPDSVALPVCNPHAVRFHYTSDLPIHTFLWDFGDNAFSTDSTPVHIYVEGDTFSVRLTATGECGPVSVPRTNYIKLTPRPTATLSVAPTFACVGRDTVAFDATVTTGRIDSARWLFGDDGTARAVATRHQYDSIGSYLPRLVIFHSCGVDTLPFNGTVDVGDVPVASFGAAPAVGYEPLMVAFTDLSAGRPNAWAWTFGDGGSSTVANPTHVYSAGRRPVGLTVNNPCGSDAAASQFVTVGGFRIASFDSSGSSGDTIRMSARIDTLVRPYDHVVFLSMQTTPTPRRGSMGFAATPASGLPPFAPVVKAIPSRDLATGVYTLELAAADPARLDQNSLPVTHRATVTVDFEARPLIDVDPESLPMDSAIANFGEIAKALLVRNSATASENVTLWIRSVFGSGAPFVLRDTSLVLGPQATLRLPVSFRPTREGEFTGSITIVSDDPARTNLTVPLTGRGIGEQIPPTVRDTTPKHNAEALISDSVRLRMSEPVSVVPLDTIFFVGSTRTGRTVPGTVRFDGVSLTFVPTGWLLPDDTITVLLRALLSDAKGNRLSGDGDGEEEGSPADDFHLVFTTGPGVWPGETNRDGVVNEVDVLPIARYYGLRDRRRPKTYPGFTLQPAWSWTPRDATHADADGNGVVDSMDICPIAEFFERTVAGLGKTSAPTESDGAQLIAESIVDAFIAALDYCPNQGPAHAALRQALERMHTVAPIPASFALEQNYPNPFNAATVIEYSLPAAADVRLEIFNILGRSVALVDDGFRSSGVHRLVWDGHDDEGRELASGMYFYRLKTPGHEEVRKMVLLK